jgi:hypothetical protein
MEHFRVCVRLIKMILVEHPVLSVYRTSQWKCQGDVWLDRSLLVIWSSLVIWFGFSGKIIGQAKLSVE